MAAGDGAQEAAGNASVVLGRFIAGSAWGAVPEAVRREVGRTLLNHLGCALGAAGDPAVRTAITVLRRIAGEGDATLVGQAERLDPMGAAFVNAIASNLLDYDDTHLRTVIHPAAPVAPAVLALAERQGLSGEVVLHATLLGIEVACRIGNAVSPGHYARGWHITASCGVFGAAAGCARLLGLPAARVADALGIAASQSGSVVENLPTAAKNVGVGNAARDGMLAALLAEAGYEAAPAAIEGGLGWARAMGDVPAIEEITGGLGTRWEAARNTYKPYPAGIVFHAVIDACLALRERLGAPLEAAIESVTVAGDALLLARGDREVRTPRDSRVSIHHCAALGLLRGRAGIEDFEATAVADPALAALRARTVAALDESQPRGAAVVTVRLRDGRSEQVAVTEPRGSEARPMSDAELEAKFRANAALGGMAGQAEALLAAIRGLEQAPDVRALMALLRRPAQPRVSGA